LTSFALGKIKNITVYLYYYVYVTNVWGLNVSINPYYHTDTLDGY